MVGSSHGGPAQPAGGSRAAGLEWFTVPEAASVLGVDEDEIFAGIRHGEIRVRFESIEATGRERPLVTSRRMVELADRGGATAEAETPGASPQTDRHLDRSGRLADDAAGGVGRPVPRPASDRDPDRPELERLRAENAALRAENAELQGSLGEFEARTEQSLRTLYERDVQIARLEAALEAAGRVENGVHRFAERLETRIERLETTAEDKEREIRRLALTLGEARGEIKLLKAPEPRGRVPWRLVARLTLPLVTAAGTGWATFWMASLQQTLGAGIVAAVGVGVTAALVLLTGWRAGGR